MLSRTHVIQFAVIAASACTSSAAATTPKSAKLCENFRTQAQMNNCAARQFETVNSALNIAYRRLISRLPDEKKEGLRVAQRAWIEYRDKHCNFAAYLVTGGTMYSLVRAGCLESVTKARTAEIQLMETDVGSN